MMKEHDCEIFQERLDMLRGAYPPGDGLEELKRFATGCRDCGTILDAYLHLAGPPIRELEAEVPPGMVESMWERVSSRTVERHSEGRRWSIWRILTPVLAAAVVVLVFGLGLTLGELRHLRGVEERMAAEIDRREETIAALRLRGGEAAGLFASERLRSLALSRHLAGRDEYRIGDLIALLEQLPRDTQVLSAKEVHELLDRTDRPAYSLYSTRLREFDYSNGLDAGEAILLIEALGIDADELIPREQIASLRGI